MAAIYVPIRIATLVVSSICLILAIIDLVDRLNSSFKDKQTIVYLSITVVVLFIGAYGSYAHARTYLITFALVTFINIIVGFTAASAAYSALGTSVALIVLSLVQAELIRRGYH